MNIYANSGIFTMMLFADMLINVHYPDQMNKQQRMGKNVNRKVKRA